jgi:hypothetical protein
MRPAQRPNLPDFEEETWEEYTLYLINEYTKLGLRCNALIEHVEFYQRQNAKNQ